MQVEQQLNKSKLVNTALHMDKLTHTHGSGINIIIHLCFLAVSDSKNEKEKLQSRFLADK